MGFLNIGLLVGMAGVAVPIIIHLLNRYRHREVDWAAMALLRQALVMRSRQIQMEDLLLLILRCLAVALLALAMARPTLTTQAVKWFGKGADIGMVVAIDASYSMDHRPTAQGRFQRALDQVRQVVQTAEVGAPVSIVLLGDRPRVLLGNVGYDPARVETVLKDARPLPERLNLELCLERVAALVDEIKAPQRECYILTDCQAVTWGQAQSGGAAGISDRARQLLERIGTASRLTLLPTGAEGNENVALVRLAPAIGANRRGGIVRYVAEVKNTGPNPAEHVAVSLLVNDQPVDQRELDRPLAAGESQSVLLSARFDAAGSMRLSARLRPDALSDDNQRHYVATVRQQVRVLLVDGDPSDKPFRGETDFLLKALAPKGESRLDSDRAAGSLKVERVSWLQIPTARLDEHDVIFLANVPDIRAEQAEALSSFVAQGGGLVLTLGDQIDPKLFNARMQSGKHPLLPAELVERVTFRPPGGYAGADVPDAGHDGWTIAPASPHRLSDLLGQVPPQLLNEARVDEAYKVKLLEGAQPILRIAQEDLPLLIERDVAGGKVLMLTTTADRAWTNLAIHPLGPMLWNEAVNYLTSQSHERSFLVGEPLDVSLPVQSSGGNVLFRDPSGKELPVQVAERDGVPRAEFNQPTQPGFYEVQYAEGAPPLVLAVNVDTRESQATPLPVEALRECLVGLPVRFLEDSSFNLAEAIRRDRRGFELWLYLMILGLCALVVEAFLARLFARRLSSREDVPVSSSREGLLQQKG